MIENCINPDKLERAQKAVAAPQHLRPDSVEYKALQMGQAEKLTGDDLVVFVYKTMGGLMLDEASDEVKEVVKPRKVRGSK